MSPMGVGPGSGPGSGPMGVSPAGVGPGSGSRTVGVGPGVGPRVGPRGGPRGCSSLKLSGCWRGWMALMQLG
jgi:hypothetical protein